MPEHRSAFDTVTVSRSGPVAVVAMNRPAKRNAMNEQLLTDLRLALVEQANDEDIDVVVLTGHGVAFSAGADRSAVAGLEGKQRAEVFAPIAAHLSALIGEVVFQLVSMPKMAVAAVNGHAAGGGMMTALGCDFRIAADDAMFWMPEIDLGRAISEPALNTLLAHVGPAVTKDIVATGRRLEAREMAHWGLVSRVVPRQDVIRFSLDFAHSLASADQQALRVIKSRSNRELRSIWDARNIQ